MPDGRSRGTRRGGSGDQRVGARRLWPSLLTQVFVVGLVGLALLYGLLLLQKKIRRTGTIER